IPNDVPLVRLRGWSALKGVSTFPAQAVYASSYQMASEAWFYSGIPATTVGPHRRSQYDLWPPPEVAPGQTVLWVSESQPPPAELRERFPLLEGPVHFRGTVRDAVLHDFQVWTLK